MSILTKVCVVIMVLMVLIAVPVFITQATVPPIWKTAYEKQAGFTKVVKMQAAHVQLALNQASTLAEKRLVELTDARQIMTMEVNKLEGLLRDQKLANATLNNELKKIRVDLMELQVTLAGEIERRVKLSGTLDTIRLENNRLTDASRRLEDLLQGSQAEAVRLNKVVKVFRDQLAEAQERIKELRVAVAAGGGTGKKPKKVIEDVPKIDGTITSLLDDIAGINIGSAQGVESDMVLIISRGSNFVARLRVQAVEIDEAAGTIFDKLDDPIKGDKVTTKLK